MQVKRRKGVNTAMQALNAFTGNAIKSMKYSNMSEIERQEEHLSKDIYKRTLDA